MGSTLERGGDFRESLHRHVCLATLDVISLSPTDQGQIVLRHSSVLSQGSYNRRKCLAE